MRRRVRTYMISAEMYAKAGNKAAFVRQAGFSKIQQEQMILSFIDAHGSINRAETIELCKLNLSQANRILKKLRDKGAIEMLQKGKNTSYVRK